MATLSNVQLCPLQAVANASSTCLFTSPASAPNKKVSGVYLLFALNLASFVALVFGLIIPNYFIKGRRQYPSNLLYIAYCEVAVHHGFVLVSLIAAGFVPYSTMTMSTDSSGNTVVVGSNDYYNFGEITCTLSQFIICFSFSTMGTNCACLASAMHASIVAGKSMKLLSKSRSRLQIVYGAVGAFVPTALSVGFGKSGVYTVYCSSVFPLWTRLFFYTGLIGHCIVTLAFMLPVIRVLIKDARNAEKTLKQSSSLTSGAKKKRSGSGVRSASRKMCLFVTIFAVGIGGASFKRIQHSIVYASYYETPDAGKIGLTEYIIMSCGLLGFLIFGVSTKTKDFYLKLMGFNISNRVHISKDRSVSRLSRSAESSAS